MREQNKTKGMEDSINERIGESSTLGKSNQYKQSKPVPQRNENAMHNNFFMTKADKDPMSIIEIFARRNAPKVVPSVAKSPHKLDRSGTATDNRRKSHV